MGAIRCAHCQGRHPSVTDVRACAANARAGVGDSYDDRAEDAALERTGDVWRNFR